MNRFTKYFSLEKGKLSFIALLFLMLGITFLFAGKGNFIERIMHNWRFFIIFSFCFLLASITFLPTYNSSIKDLLNDMPKKYFYISYSNRIKLAILGSVLLILHIINVIYCFIDIKDPLYILELVFLFLGGMSCWFLALADPTLRQLDWKMLNKPEISSITMENENKNFVSKKNTEKVIYIYFSFIIFLLIISGIILIINTNYRKEGFIELIISFLSAIILMYTIKKILKDK